MSDMYRPDEREVARESRDGLLLMIGQMRTMYEPRPTAWTDKNDHERRAITAEWLSQLGQFEDEHVAEAISRHMDGPSGSFFPSLGDLVRLCVAVARDRSAAQRQEGVRATSGVCDGSGWLTDPDGKRFPCGRCNPILRMVYNDHRKWQKYLHGAAIHTLGVGAQRVAGVLTADTPMPDPCVPAADGDLDPRQFSLLGAAMKVRQDKNWLVEQGVPNDHDHSNGIEECPRCGDLTSDILWPLAVEEAERRMAR